ncbi:Hypothetical protein PHPALM_11958 [Phytophthora palmivora]|uniref:Uncharacterized protein n=1 Tax=Phytophthora palmivora TaxID=4796 RepID=A0A2P4Y0Z5_9STRA|nr:Hypothetical protein PHPALM_11958 [Phytophthora palmivora]
MLSHSLHQTAYVHVASKPRLRISITRLVGHTKPHGDGVAGIALGPYGSGGNVINWVGYQHVYAVMRLPFLPNVRCLYSLASTAAAQHVPISLGALVGCESRGLHGQTIVTLRQVGDSAVAHVAQERPNE